MILLLAGTAEAGALAAALSAGGIAALASLSGATRHPEPMPLPTRVGGFGGEAGFRDTLAAQGITAVIDATHPFAAAITARTVRVCADLGLPYLRLDRPGWQPQVGDRWTTIDTAAEAADHIAPGQTVFLATGRQTVADFADLAGRTVHARIVDPPDAPFPIPGGSWVVGRPPFGVAREIDTFRTLGIDWLVVKDSGGDGGRAKLDAACALGLPVLLLRRPPPPDTPCVASVAEALDWAQRVSP